jgi:hypothetical protein
MGERENTSQQKIWHEYYEPGVGLVNKLLTPEEIEVLNHQSGDIRSYTLNKIKEHSHGETEAEKINAKYLANRR